MRSGRSPLVALLYWSFVLFLCVIVTEASVRVWGLAPTYTLQARAIPYSLQLVLDDARLFRVLPDERHSINPSGFRDAPFVKRDPNRSRTLILGDSFPMGLFVDPTETFPKQLEQKLPKSEVLNLGIQGYGPDQELVVLKTIGTFLKPDTVVWSLFPVNDYSDIRKNELFHLDPSGALTRTSPNAVTSLYPLFRASMLFRFLATGRFLSPEKEAALHPILFADYEEDQTAAPEIIDLMRAILSAGRDTARDMDAHLIALILPSYQQALPNSTTSTALNTTTKSLLNSLGIQTIDLSDSFRGHPELYTEEEHHLSKAGHAAVADALVKAIASAP